jgi:hypothetical protein
MNKKIYILTKMFQYAPFGLIQFRGYLGGIIINKESIILNSEYIPKTHTVRIIWFFREKKYLII